MADTPRPHAGQPQNNKRHCGGRSIVSVAPRTNPQTQNDSIQDGTKMKTLKRVDVAIVGGGWTGLAMAKEITGRTSLSVLILERGAPRKTADFVEGMDELDYAIRVRLMQNIAQETITHRHSTRDASVPVRQYGSFLPGSGVGGAGEHWAGVSHRYMPDIFTLRSHLAARHGAARL